MSGMLGAKLWGVGVAALCFAVAACAPDGEDPSDPTVLTTQSLSNLPLSHAEMRRALLARAVAARHGSKPGETVFRAYDSLGHVLTESVLLADGWATRASTLPATIASQPLRSFLPTRASLIYDTTSVTTQAAAYTFTDYDSTTAHANDTLASGSVVQKQDLYHDTDHVGDGAASEITYSDFRQVGNLSYSSWATTVVDVPPYGGSDDFYEEFTIDGTNWSGPVATVLSDTSGWHSGHLRSGSLRNIPVSPQDISFSHASATRGCQSFLNAAYRTTDPCSQQKSAAAYAIGTAVVIGVVSFGLSWLTGGASWAGTSKYLYTSVAAAAGTLLLYAKCRHDHGYAAFTCTKRERYPSPGLVED